MACDHAAFELKTQIIDYLDELSYEIEDFGAFSENRVDYPDIISKAAFAVSKGECEKGIFLCGSGVGASIVANKVPGIRAVLCFSEYIAEMSRRHNDANVLVLAGRLVTFELAKRYIDVWMNSPFDGGRHQDRLDKIKVLEQKIKE